MALQSCDEEEAWPGDCGISTLRFFNQVRFASADYWGCGTTQVSSARVQHDFALVRKRKLERPNALPMVRCRELTRASIRKLRTTLAKLHANR